MSEMTHEGQTTGKWAQARRIVSSRNFLRIVVGLQAFLCAVLLWAIYWGAEISSGPGNWITIRSSTSKQLAELQRQFEEFKNNSVSREKYDELQQRILDLERTTVNIGLLPATVRADDPMRVVENIESLAAEAERLERDVSFSMAVVSREITANRIINTRRCTNAMAKRLNFHIQACLEVIGFHDGRLDGAPDATYNDVVRFQQAHNLKMDGRIGKITWQAVTEVYEKQCKES